MPWQVIRACPLFAGLHPSRIDTLASAARVEDFESGETIFQQGDACPGVFIVERGLVRICCEGTSGQRHVLHLCGPGQSFAEVAVFANFTMPAVASCVEPTRCVRIPADFMQHLIDTDHEFCRQMLEGMAHWTRHFTELLGDIVLRDASDRVAIYLAALPRDDDGLVELPGPKKDIANHLNLTSETFSRTLRRLSDRGQIELTQGRRIRVVGLG